MRRHDAANEQDRPVGRIVQRGRKKRGDIRLEIGTQGFAHTTDQSDPIGAKRDDAADQRFDGARRVAHNRQCNRIVLTRHG